MPTLDNLAARFAQCVSLFRDPSAKTEQKKEFRALLGLLQDAAVTLRLAPGGSGIELNGVPCEAAGLATLVERLDLHGIGEIALPANPPPTQLFELLQALADQPGTHDVASRLAAAGADRIRIAPAGPSPSPSVAQRGPVASPEDFGGREPVIPNPDTPVDRKSGALGTAGILRGESMRDIKSVPLQGVPLVTHDPPPPKPSDALPGVVDRPRPRKESGEELLSLSSERHPEPELPHAAPPPPRAPPSPPEPGPPAVAERDRAPAARATRGDRVALPPGAADVLAELERNSTAPNVGDLLAALIDNAAAAAKLGRFEQVLGVIVGVI